MRQPQNRAGTGLGPEAVLQELRRSFWRSFNLLSKTTNPPRSANPTIYLPNPLATLAQQAYTAPSRFAGQRRGDSRLLGSMRVRGGRMPSSQPQRLRKKARLCKAKISVSG